MASKNKKMNVYVISTSGHDNSFLEVRKKLFELISSMGMTSNGYELKNYALTPDNTITQDCINNMRSADLFLIFLNERYGFIEDGYTKSVTHTEIEEALKSSKPYLIFAQDVLMDALDLPDDYELSSVPRYAELVKDPNIEEQFKLLKGIAAEHTIIKYPHTNIDDVIDLAKNKILGLSSFYISKFVEKQTERIKDYSKYVLNNTPTSKVPLLYRVNGEYDTSDLSSFCANNLLNGVSNILEGECGAGKSFATSDSFVTFAGEYYEKLSDTTRKIPIFLEFRSYKYKRFRAKSYITQVYSELLGYTPPTFIINKMLEQGIIVFGDALDEWKFSTTHTELCSMIKSLGSPFMISMRTSTFNRISASLSIESFPHISVSVCGWLKKDLLTHAHRYLDNPNISTGSNTFFKALSPSQDIIFSIHRL